jgi:hypothetical protein
MAGIPCEEVRVTLGRQEQRKPEFLAVNPLGKVPALQVGYAASGGCPLLLHSQTLAQLCNSHHKLISCPPTRVAPMAQCLHRSMHSLAYRCCRTQICRCACLSLLLQDGDLCLPESSAIMQYMCSTRSLEDHWYPSNVRDRALINAAMAWHASSLRIGSMLTVWNRAITLK